MKTNDAGIALIKEFEGLRTTAYKDPVGIWTIGYGHTTAAGFPPVYAGQKITAAEAESILRADLAKFEGYLASMVTAKLNENQHGALVSLIYNIGPENFRTSTLRKKLNAGDYDGAAAEFGRWNKAGGKVLAGLTRRRAAERELFERDVPVTLTKPGFLNTLIAILARIFGGKK